MAESVLALQGSLQDWSVLYVDDDALVRGAVVRLLQSAGAICYAADTHDHAVQLAGDRRRIDLAILDYQMPDGDVASLVRRLRLLRPWLPLMGTSGADRRADFSFRGVDQFLQKPLRLGELLQICDSLLPT